MPSDLLNLQHRAMDHDWCFQNVLWDQALQIGIGSEKKKKKHHDWQ